MSRAGYKERRTATTPRPSATKRPWTREKLYFHGEGFFQDVFSAIGRAEHTVDVETYIYEEGELGDEFARVLGKAVRRGVRVRILVDGVGSPDFEKHYGPRMDRLGVQYRVYRSWPVFFSSILKKFDWFNLGKSFQVAYAIFMGGKHRDHRKQFIVDDQKVWIGSFNVSDWHLQEVKGEKTWRDSGVGLWGLKTYVFKLAFHIAWEDSWPRNLRAAYRTLLSRQLSHDLAGSPIRMTADRKLRHEFRKELLERVRSARERIWAITPYFMPTGILLKALAEADKRGADVRLILPGVSDVPGVRWASKTFFAYLLRAGCRLYEYQGRILHAKTLMVDDWILIGSSNLDHRSLRFDLEVNIVVQEKQSLRDLERQFKKDLLACREVTMEDLRMHPLWDKVLSWFFFHFRYWF